MPSSRSPSLRYITATRSLSRVFDLPFDDDLDHPSRLVLYRADASKSDLPRNVDISRLCDYLA